VLVRTSCQLIDDLEPSEASGRESSVSSGSVSKEGIIVSASAFEGTHIKYSAKIVMNPKPIRLLGRWLWFRRCCPRWIIITAYPLIACLSYKFGRGLALLCLMQLLSFSDVFFEI
jgi:hypothetical protein